MAEKNLGLVGAKAVVVGLLVGVPFYVLGDVADTFSAAGSISAAVLFAVGFVGGFAFVGSSALE